MVQFSVKADLTIGKCVVEGILELSAKNLPEHLLRQKEPVARIGADPALMIEGQSTGGNDAVHVRMMLHCLSPGMEHAKEADLGTETFWVAGNFDQRFRTEAQQHGIDQLLVLQSKLCQGTWHGENDVSIGDRKKFFLPSR